MRSDESKIRGGSTSQFDGASSKYPSTQANLGDANGFVKSDTESCPEPSEPEYPHGGSFVANPCQTEALSIAPCSRDAADAYIVANHRHHGPTRGALFRIGATRGGELVGVVVVGRPSARLLQDGRTAEVTRLCTDGTRNACSFLYAAAWRAARALGWRRLVTYTLPEEGGSSLRAAGWQLIGETRGGSWSRRSRPRVDHLTQPKLRWQAVAP